jgi:hypothetical protein
MTALITRLEEAGEGSRELDAAIWRWTDGWRGVDHPPAYTTSIDAALTLAERVLPGWGWVLSTGARGGHPAWVQAYPEPVDEDVCRDAVASASLPLALCAAILKATDTGREG